MAALIDTSKQIKLWLSEQGLFQEESERGMRLLLGKDWEKNSLPEMREKLRVKGLRIPLQFGHPFRFNSATDSD